MWIVFSRIIFWALSGVFAALSVPQEVQDQITTLIGGDPIIAAIGVALGTAYWYWKDKLSRGQT